ncbi:hypothetical protein SprV_0702365100 [Sparganum proliferum]
MVCADAGGEVPKDNQLIPPQRSRQFWDVGADDGDEVGSPNGQAQAHQSAVDALRQIGESSHNIVPDGKSDVRVSSFCLGAAAPEGVADTHILHLALLRESDSAECSGVRLVARQFQSNYRRPLFRSVAPETI